MKQTLSILFSLIFITSCAGNAPSAPAASAVMTGTTAATGTPLLPENTATSTFTPEPTITPSPVPPPARWYWGIRNGTNQFIAVNQYGKTHEVGSLPDSELVNYKGFPLDHERELLVTEEQSRLRAYLLTLDGMQPIQLPPELTYNLDQSGYSMVMPAVYGDHVVFGYTDQRSEVNSMADRGPLVFIDLQSLTGSILDKQVNHDLLSPVNDPRLWAHVSEDGRFLRYLDGDKEGMNVRELDMSTGEVRTLNTTTGHATTNINASLQGDMWRFSKDGLIFDLNGNQTTFTDDTRFFRPLRDGKGLVLPVECDDNCELKLVAPFADKTELTYTLPWASSYSFHNPLIYIPIPDQSLIYVGAQPAWLSSPPAILGETPTLMENDKPVFRLTPDGGSRLVGVYKSEFAQDSTPVSTDGRYMLLEAIDHESFFIYDAFEDHSLAELPAVSELDYFWGNAGFYDNGIIAHLTASTVENTYRSFFLMQSLLSGKSYSWEDESGLSAGCVDILPDDSVVCWVYKDDQQSYNLVRYDPETQKTEVLLENAVFINDVR